MSEKIMLIDGNSIINRAFYALPILTNKDGEYTNGVYGFLNIFFKLYDEEKPDHIAVAFDLPKPTVRHDQYSQYKGTRKGMPEELRPQLPLLKSLLEKMNIKTYEQAGYEADDILGTLAIKAEKEGIQPVIISGDRDMLQLCSETIKVRIPKTKGGKTIIEDYNLKEVVALMGVTPKEYIDVKALMGDTSDNIPGVPGIGEKTALKIIQQYHTLESAIENAPNIKPNKASQNIQTYKEQAILSKTLATIILNTPLDMDFTKTKVTDIYNSCALEEIKRLGFKTIYTRFEHLDVQTEQNIEHVECPYDKITQIKHLEKFAQNLLNEHVAAFTFIFNEDSFLGISFYSPGITGTFIELGSNLSNDHIFNTLNHFFTSSIKKLTLDCKRECTFARKFGIIINNITFDATLAAYIINSSKNSYTYDSIAKDFLDEYLPPVENIMGKGRNRLTLENINTNTMLNYCCKQSEIVYKSFPVMDKIITQNKQQELYYNIELPLAFVLSDMEQWGIKVDKKALTDYGKSLDENINILTEEIYTLSDETFNINSPQQLGIILFEKLGLKSSKKTKTGYSTAADVLEKLVNKHPVVDKVLAYRTLTKLKSTYVDGLLSVISPKTGKIHSTFNQTIASTGRISSTEPNLQNIPVRIELGRKLRKVFIPSNDEFVFLDGDYSQIELRVLAHMSGDETLINAFKENQDIHRLTASQVLKIPYDQVSHKERNNAKAVNFGIVYGIGSFSLSQDLNITKQEADNYIKGYFEKYPKVKDYMDKTIEKANADGYVSTIFNRRRYIPELTSSNFNMRSFGERVAMNMPIQGTAADIIKIAMIKVYKELKNQGLKSRLILQVHDELLLEVHKNEIEIAKQILKNEMEHCVALLVPLDTDFHIGDTWYDTK